MRYSIVFLKSLGIIFISSIIGFFLLLLVFTLPTDKIEFHISESVKIFQKENIHPKVKTINRWEGTALDNFTDAYMLLMASYSGQEALIDKVVDVYSLRIPGKNPVNTIVGLYSGDKAVEIHTIRMNYGRCWNGYLVILKPLLLMFNYREIRHLNAAFVCIMALLMILFLYKRKMKEYIIPYLITLFLLDPFAISKSLIYSTDYYVFSLFSIIMLMKIDDWKGEIEKFVLLFVLIGCTTAYMDLIAFPFVTFGIPATLYLCKNNYSARKDFKVLVLFLLAWGFGYVGMWSAKWILGTLLGTQNIISGALKAVALRSGSTTVRGEQISFLTVLKLNLRKLKSPVLIICGLYTASMCVVSFLNRHYITKQKIKSALIYIFVAMLPLLWYAVALNHSFVHCWMTYREFTIAIFALMCMVTKCSKKSNEAGC